MGNPVSGLSNRTSNQQKSPQEAANAEAVTEDKCSSDIRLRLDPALKSNIEKESINPIQYSNLSTGEKKLVEAATNREKCVHQNQRPEIGLIESRIKRYNDDGTVFLDWNGFYYRVYYQNRREELAS